MFYFGRANNVFITLISCVFEYLTVLNNEIKFVNNKKGFKCLGLISTSLFRKSRQCNPFNDLLAFTIFGIHRTRTHFSLENVFCLCSKWLNKIRSNEIRHHQIFDGFTYMSASNQTSLLMLKLETINSMKV